MKRLLLLIFLSTTAVSSFAQFYETDTVPITAGKELIAASRSMIAGTALMIGGSALSIMADDLVNHDSKTYESNLKTLKLTGIGLALAGVAVSINGYIRIGKAGEKLELIIKSNGAGLAFKF